MNELIHLEPICHLAGAGILAAIIDALMKRNNLTEDRRERLKIAESLIHVVLLLIVGLLGILHANEATAAIL